MPSERLQAIDAIQFAKMPHDLALYDLGTRDAFIRGFEAMRAIAIEAVRPKTTMHSELSPKDFDWGED